MPKPPNYPTGTINTKAELNALFPNGNNCCNLKGPKGNSCTIPDWISHSVHEAWNWYGFWSGGSFGFQVTSLDTWPQSPPVVPSVYVSGNAATLTPSPASPRATAKTVPGFYSGIDKIPLAKPKRNPYAESVEEWDLLPDASGDDLQNLPTYDKLKW